MFYTYRKVLVIISLVFCLFSRVYAYSGGTGEPNDPYQIADVNDLLALGGTPTDCNKCFILTADINMAGQVFTTAIIAADTVAGNYTFEGPVFTGTFDGNGYKITHFTIVGGSNDFLGLFGNISSAGSVKNLGLENCAVSSSSGSQCVGSIVGLNYGSITNCYSTGSIIGDDYYTGGLCGINDNGSISNCYSTSNVSGDSFTGGLVGYNYGGSISNCYSAGNVSGYNSIGGLCGYTSGSISNCYSTGAVSGGSYAVGGLVGSNNGIVVSSFWDVNTSGQTTSAGGEGKTTEQMQDINTFLNAGWDLTNIWRMSTKYYEYPHLRWEYPAGYSGGSGTETDPYIIAVKEDLLVLAETPADYDKCFILTSDIDLNGYIFTKAIIGENGTMFSGVFDGNGHIIRNVRINGPNNDDVGLFGLVSGGQIRNLGAEDVNIIGGDKAGGLVGYNYGGSINNCYSAGDVDGYWSVGGLVGYNIFGIFSNCYSAGTVIGSLYVGGLVGDSSLGRINNCYSTGNISGSVSDIGGLVGQDSSSDISFCYSASVVGGSSSDVFGLGGLVGQNNSGAISNCYSAGAVSGNSDVSGLVGSSNDGLFNNCYSTSDVNGNSVVSGFLGATHYDIIINCYSAGAISGNSYVGGLVGYNGDGSSFISSFWDVNTSGQATSAGGEGKTTDEMQTLSTFTSAGWDFSYTDGDEADWFIQIDEYPILTWQISPADIYTDGRNNFRDFAIFAQYWMREDCAIYNYYCDWADLDFNGSVDIDDLIILMSYWLETGIY